MAWSVEAVLDRHHGIDVKARAPFEVLSSSELFVEEATSDPIQVDGPGVELELLFARCDPATPSPAMCFSGPLNR